MFINNNLIRIFALQIIHMQKNKVTITDKTGLVLEGGGMRGIFTIGVLDNFMDRGIRFPYIIRCERRSLQCTLLYVQPTGQGKVLQHRHDGEI